MALVGLFQKRNHWLRRRADGAYYVEPTATCGGPDKCRHCDRLLARATKEAKREARRMMEVK